MGVIFGICVSGSVTQEDWKKTYDEVLILLKGLNLADLIAVDMEGYKVYCLVPAEERRYAGDQFWFERVDQTGWRAVGDMVSLRRGEDFFLPKVLTNHHSNDCSCSDDAILGMASVTPGIDWDYSRYNNYFRLWKNKTQGMPYHSELLAVTV